MATDPSTFAIDSPLVRRVRGRRRFARTFGWAIFPLFFATAVLAGRSPWWWAVGVPAMLLQQGLVLRGYLQRCPRCGRSLTVQHWWGRILPPACPACGLMIDRADVPEASA
jgi:hypothetical protein